MCPPGRGWRPRASPGKLMGKHRKASYSRWFAEVGPYVAAVAATGVAVLLRWLLDPWMGDYQPLTTLYGAVAVAVWFGGYRTALFTVVLGYLVSSYLFIKPHGGMAVPQVRDCIGAVLYLLACGII